MAETVRHHRLAAGMTQEQLAQRSGVSLATVRSIEAGRVKKPYRLRDIYRALGIASAEPAVALTDAELLAELERRYPGRAETVALAWELAPEVMARVTGHRPPAARTEPERSTRPVPRPGERSPETSQQDDEAV